jgi:hypothetical protein
VKSEPQPPGRILQPSPVNPVAPRQSAARPPGLPAAPAPAAPVAPEWKVLEPADQSDPVPHEVSELAVTETGWNLLAASVRGKLHAHKALWRDDAYQWGCAGPWTVVALSDGAGSARLARVGARVACAQAVATVKEALGQLHLTPAADATPTAAEQERLRHVLIDGAVQARAALVSEANRRRCPLRDLNATFLLLAHTPYGGGAFLGAVQVGDGAIGVFTEDDCCHLLAGADHGQYSGETCFLTTPGVEEQLAPRVRFAFFKKVVRALAVMCDGVSDDFFPEERRLIELFNGSPVQELKTRQGESVWGVLHKSRGIVHNLQGGRALLDWLRYEKRGSSDDRTLVLLYRGPTP